VTVQFSANFPVLGLFANFSGAVWTDISEYVRRLDIDRGPSRETGRYPAGSMTVQLANRDARFSPANTSGPYVSGGVTQVVAEVKVRLEATWNSVTYNLFCGLVEDWQDEFPDSGYDAVTVLTALDPLTTLATWNGSPLVSVVGNGERTGARISRILDAVGFDGATRSVMTGDDTLQATTLTGSATEQINLVTDSEGGALWYDPLRSINADMGGLVWESRSALKTNTRSTVSQATFSAASIGFRDPRTSSGRDFIVRYAGFARVGGVEQGSGSGLPRLTRYDLVNETDVGVGALSAFTVAKGKPGDYRITGLTIDPITKPATAWPAALGLRVRDRATVAMTIPVSGLVVNKNVFIDGISHSILPMQWATSFDFASATNFDTMIAASVWTTGLWDTAGWWF